MTSPARFAIAFSCAPETFWVAFVFENFLILRSGRLVLGRVRKPRRQRQRGPLINKKFNEETNRFSINKFGRPTSLAP